MLVKITTTWELLKPAKFIFRIIFYNVSNIFLSSGRLYNIILQYSFLQFFKTYISESSYRYKFVEKYFLLLIDVYNKKFEVLSKTSGKF